MGRTPPPNEAQCKSRWELVSAKSLSFGAFSIEMGSGNLQINSSGVLTTTGAITTVSTSPVSTFTVTITNTKDLPFVAPILLISVGVCACTTDRPWCRHAADECTGERAVINSNSDTTSNTGTVDCKPPHYLDLSGRPDGTFPQAAGLYTSPALLWI